MNLELPPKPKDNRYLTLDACRGMACVMLVVFHATFFAEVAFKLEDKSTWTFASILMRVVRLNWAGVPIFFVISGYCIAASLDSMRRKPFTLWSYFSRRIRRIYPPFWIGLSVAVVFVLVLGAFNALDMNDPHVPKLKEFTALNWLGNFTISEWWLQSFTGDKSRAVMNNTWTLCFEEQFYVVMAFVLMLAARRMFLASMLVSVATLALRHFSRAKGLTEYTHGFFFDGLWLLFAAGILVYQRLNYLKGWVARAAEVYLAVGIVYGLLEYKTGNAMNNFHIKHFGEYVIVAHEFALVLIVCKRWDKAIVNSWLMRPFLFCGKISYSIYLSHYLPVVMLASYLARRGITDDLSVTLITLPLCLLIVPPIAWTFHVLVERRFLNAPIEEGDVRKQSAPVLNQD